MGATTFITQRQLMARNKASGGPAMPGNQQTLLYILPLVFAVFGLKFPIGVLLYWLTTNLWSMGQQAIVIRRMDNPTAPAATGAAPRHAVRARRRAPARSGPHRPPARRRAPETRQTGRNPAAPARAMPPAGHRTATSATSRGRR